MHMVPGQRIALYGQVATEVCDVEALYDSVPPRGGMLCCCACFVVHDSIFDKGWNRNCLRFVHYLTAAIAGEVSAVDIDI